MTEHTFVPADTQRVILDSRAIRLWDTNIPAPEILRGERDLRIVEYRSQTVEKGHLATMIMIAIFQAHATYQRIRAEPPRCHIHIYLT